MHTYHSPLDLVRERSPERPVALVRPDTVALAARWFQKSFTGDVLYAVKANPSPWVIKTLAENGLRAFDVASVPEIELVAQHAPGSKMAFMHPVKSRTAISAAYFDHGIRTFALDTHEELAKIIETAKNEEVSVPGFTVEVERVHGKARITLLTRQPDMPAA